MFSSRVRAAAEAGKRRPVSGPTKGSSAAARTLGPIKRFILRVEGKSDEEVKEEIERQFAPTKGWV